jgi:hypothetical protein
MRFMIIREADRDTEAGTAPSPKRRERIAGE